MVGTTGFEPATSCSQSKRSTKLSHVPALGGVVSSRRYTTAVIVMKTTVLFNLKL